MGDGKEPPRFDAKERGTDDRLTRDGAGGPRGGPGPPSAAEVARAQAVAELRRKFRADVDGLIKLGGALQGEFVAAGL